MTHPSFRNPTTQEGGFHPDEKKKPCTHLPRRPTAFFSFVCRRSRHLETESRWGVPFSRDTNDAAAEITIFFLFLFSDGHEQEIQRIHERYKFSKCPQRVYPQNGMRQEIPNMYIFPALSVFLLKPDGKEMQVIRDAADGGNAPRLAPGRRRRQSASCARLFLFVVVGSLRRRRCAVFPDRPLRAG